MYVLVLKYFHTLSEGFLNGYFTVVEYYLNLSFLTQTHFIYIHTHARVQFRCLK